MAKKLFIKLTESKEQAVPNGRIKKPYSTPTENTNPKEEQDKK